MKRSIWIFFLAIVLPSIGLGWLALRSANEQQIILERRTDHVSLIIEDNGVGYDTNSVSLDDDRFGIRGMRERALLVGGIAEIESRPGEGVTVIVRIPAPTA